MKLFCVCWWNEVIGDALTAKTGYAVDELPLVVCGVIHFFPKFKTIKNKWFWCVTEAKQSCSWTADFIAALLRVTYENAGFGNVVLFTCFALTSSPLLRMPWSKTNRADHQSNRPRRHYCNPAGIHGALKRHLPTMANVWKSHLPKNLSLTPSSLDWKCCNLSPRRGHD